MSDRSTPVSAVVESDTVKNGDASECRHSSPVMTISAAGKIPARTLLAIRVCAEIARIHLEPKTDSKVTK